VRIGGGAWRRSGAPICRRDVYWQAQPGYFGRQFLRRSRRKKSDFGYEKRELPLMQERSKHVTSLLRYLIMIFFWCSKGVEAIPASSLKDSYEKEQNKAEFSLKRTTTSNPFGLHGWLSSREVFS
jgi:hypothetical protein